MEKFIGTKIIKAEVMNLGDYNNFKGWDIPKDEDPGKDGCLVGYSDSNGNFDGPLKDGCHYLSWSPKAVFDVSYKKFKGGSFSSALEALKIGFAALLPSWQEDVKIKAQFPGEHSKMTAPYLYVESRFGKVPWKETMIELFSDDWEIVE